MRSPRFFALSASLALLIASTGALAQTPPESARTACRSSAMSLCHDQAVAHDRAGVRACLIKNFDKVTPDCQAAMKAMQAAAAAKEDATPPKP